MTIVPPPPLEKNHLPLSQQPLLKVEFLSSPPFFKFGWRLNPPPLQKGGWGVGCTLCNFDWDWKTESWVKQGYYLQQTPTSWIALRRVALYFPCDLNHPLKFDWQTGRQERQADQNTSMLVVVTHLKHLIYKSTNINHVYEPKTSST